MKCLPALLLPLLFSACMHNESRPIHFYRLNADAVNPPRQLSAPAFNGRVGLGSVHVAEYLKRPQMMIGVGDNEFKLDEQHRWAEHLDQNITNALLKALPGYLGSQRIARHPWPKGQTIDYQIGIDILEFHIDANGQSRLMAQWTIKHKDQTLIEKHSLYQAPASTTDYDLMVKAQSLCLSKLAQEIAATLRNGLYDL